jgi:truncated hemoglobin YjbI
MFMSKRPIDTWGLLETFIDDALDGFYGYMDSDDDLSPFMDGRNIGRLKKTQRDH